MPGIHPAILFIVIKNIILFSWHSISEEPRSIFSCGGRWVARLSTPSRRSTLPSASNRGSKMRNSPKEPGLAFWIKIATPGLADHPEWLPA